MITITKRFGWIMIMVVFGMLLLTTLKVYAAPKGYKITVKLIDSKDTTLYLAHYYGSKQYLDDTAYVNKQGVFEFSGEEKLQEGMYIIAGQAKSRYFDFFLTGSQVMEFRCSPTDVVNTMEVKGSEENKQFYQYIGFIGARQKEIEPWNNWKIKNKGHSDSLLIVQAKIDAIDTEAKNFIRNYYTTYPDHLAARFVKANNEPDIKPFLTDATGKVDSTRLFAVYKEHYFDNFEFRDPRLVYTPIFTSKMDTYLDKLVVPTLDSLQKDIDRLFLLASSNPETQKYLAWYLSLKYETSEIMGHDALFVYVVRNYLENGKVEWQYPTVKDNIIKRVNVLEPLLLNKPAPEMIMLDTNNVAQSLYATKAKYTLVFFWESTCGHCQKEMPKVLTTYEEFNKLFKFEIYGVSGDTSLVKWKDYIKKNKMPWINVNGHLSLKGNYHTLYDINSTPVMYLLDENKKILTKKLLIDQLSDFIRKREDALQKEAAKEKGK
jgi:thiol-disulfide isomerase/thioredoxin